LFSLNTSNTNFIIMADEPVTDYVTLVASDGYTFVVRRSAAKISGAIKRMLDPASTSPSIANRAYMY
jgi:hypothetical protein